MSELDGAKGQDAHLDRAINNLGGYFRSQNDMEYRARTIVEKMALAIQGASLIQYGDPKVAEAFCAARLSGDNSGWVYGTLPAGIDCAALIERATPKI